MPAIDPNHEAKRTLFRTLGPLLIVVGIVMIIGGIAGKVKEDDDWFRRSKQEAEDWFRGGPVDIEGWVERQTPNGPVREPLPKGFGLPESEGAPGIGSFAFVMLGIPVLGVGVALTSMGFQGAVARYEAAELAPVAADTINSVAEEAGDGIRAVAQAIGEGIAAADGDAEPAAGPVCPGCATANGPGARFCKKCGVQLARACGVCGKSNAMDAGFCEGCGARLGETQ